MKKFAIIQMYNCEKRRRIMVQVQDVITGEYYHLTEQEWELVKDEKYSEEQSEAFKAELKNRSYLQVMDEAKSKTRKGKRK